MKRILEYYLLGKSIKEIEMDKILKKKHKGSKLTERESKFFDLYKSSKFKDFMLISKNLVISKINNFIENKIIVICDLEDRNGKIGLPIIEIVKDSIIMKSDETFKLHDKFLYNLIYMDNGNYSLQEQDEYFEKIEIDK